jgi:hypothetical protein
MSKVVIQGHASGTGDFTIAAPNSNTDRTLTLPDVAGTVLTSGSNADFPAGSVLQVVTAIATEPQTITNVTSYTALNDLSLNITPTSASSKILLIANVNANTNFRYHSFRIYRDSTPVGINTTTGVGNSELVSFHLGMNSSESNNQYIVQSGGGSVLDAPSTTSQITYSIQARLHYGSSGILYINRPSYIDSNNSYTMYTTSNFIAMEIAQ